METGHGITNEQRRDDDWWLHNVDLELNWFSIGIKFPSVACATDLKYILTDPSEVKWGCYEEINVNFLLEYFFIIIFIQFPVIYFMFVSLQNLRCLFENIEK